MNINVFQTTLCGYSPFSVYYVLVLFKANQEKNMSLCCTAVNLVWEFL